MAARVATHLFCSSTFLAAPKERKQELRGCEEMAEELEELGGGGGTLSAEALQGGPESLEDREKRMASSQRLAALQVKYSKDVVELAHNLIQARASPPLVRYFRKPLRAPPTHRVPKPPPSNKKEIPKTQK